MRSNTLQYFMMIVTVLTSYACGVISLDSEQSIIIVENFPDDAASLNAALTNNESKSWKVTGFILGGNSSFQTCRLDDRMMMNNDGTYQYDGGDELCGSEDDTRLKSGSWEVDFDHRILYFDKGTENEIEVFIESCQDSEVIISSKYFGMSVLGQFQI